MSAKEMFEEYNLKQKICRYKGKIDSISYITKENFKPQVSFNLKTKTYKVFYIYGNSYDENASAIDMILHEAINKQIEELGWNNVKTNKNL